MLGPWSLADVDNFSRALGSRTQGLSLGVWYLVLGKLRQVYCAPDEGMVGVQTLYNLLKKGKCPASSQGLKTRSRQY